MSNAAIAAQGTTLHVAGTAATPESLTAITVGFPTIIAITGHAGVADGDRVTLADFAGADAALLNGLTFTVKNYATGASNDTFAIDVNTVGKTITIGTATATPTAWIKVGNIKGVKPSNPTTSERVTTDLDSTAVETGGGLTDYGNVSLDNFVVVGDAGQAAMQALFISKAVTSFKVTYPSGTTPIRTFPGWVKDFPDMGDASIDGSVSGTITIRRTGVSVAS